MINLFQVVQPGFILPNHPLGWLGWFVLAALLVWGTRHWRENRQGTMKRWWLLVILLAITPLCASLFGIRLPGEALPLPDTPMEAFPPVLMVLGALPWVLAGGLIGPLPAVILAVIDGAIFGVFATHSPFTMLEMGALALLFSAAVRQNYRGWFFQGLRHPLGAAAFTLLAYIPILISSAFFFINGSLVARVDYALTQVWWGFAGRAGEIFLASLAAELLFWFAPRWWGRRAALVPSPLESSIQARFFYAALPLLAVLMLTLVIGDWWSAGNAARAMLEQRLSSTAQVAAESLPYFLETGQNLILTLATPDLITSPVGNVPAMLAKKLRSVPYFRQLYLFDSRGFVSSFPEEGALAVRLSTEETNGIALALKGVSTQVYVLRPATDDALTSHSARISFIAAVRDEKGTVRGVLLGRTDLVTNPFSQPVIKALDGMRGLEGEGMILDERGQILYHPVASEVMMPYLGWQANKVGLHDEPSSNNTRQFVYYQPVAGRPWVVVLAVPARQAQQTALGIAMPLLLMLAVISIVALIFLRLGLRALTASLQLLSQEAAYIAQGQLDRPLQVRGVDEVGRLSQTFERMRTSLQARLHELNSLLQVSQGVASNLDIGEAVRPILQSAVADEACAARLVFVRDVTLDPNNQLPVTFGIGPAAQLYATFDQQLFDLLQRQDLLSLPNVARMHTLQYASGAAHPGAVLALAVRRDTQYFGVLWVAYDKPRNFSEEQIRFLTTLASEAALAAASARLYATAEVGRQRLEAVLASTPEPVLVIDEYARLLLLNPAAVQASGLILSAVPGSPIQQVVSPAQVLEMLTTPLAQRSTSREITLANGKIYYTSVSPVTVEGRSVGRVCILRDITHFKELEQLKSEFVSTVSHDLRSPLTLMRGYATMLQMVGELNEQQKGYVTRILGGVANMSRLVSNLLDLGRIETGIGLQVERVAIRQIVDDVTDTLQLQAGQKDIRLTKEIAESANNLTIEADKALIQQALVNLVENAIKYTTVGGQIRIRVNAPPGVALIEVHDTGIGIAPLDLPHLFEKFYRSGRREAYQQRGTGLGLAIVKSIAERHSGRVWVDSQLGKGSIFYLEIPCEQILKAREEQGSLSSKNL